MLNQREVQQHQSQSYIIVVLLENLSTEAKPQSVNPINVNNYNRHSQGTKEKCDR